MNSGHESSENQALGLSPRRRRRRKGRTALLLISLILFVLIVAGLIYYVFFRVYDVAPRTISVDGEDVEQINGLAVHSHTWLKRDEVQQLLNRIHADGVAVPSAVKTYENVPYVRVDDFLRALSKYGDESKLSNHRLLITLKSNQHYSYQDKQDFVHQQEIWVNGQLAGRVLAVDHDEATYVPTADVARLFTQAGLKSTWSGQTLNLALAGTVNVPPVWKPEQDRMIAFGNGQAIYAPYHEWQQSTYLPIYSVDAALAKLGWTGSFDTWKWTVHQNAKSSQGQAGQTAGHEGHPISLAFVPFYVGALSSFHDVMAHPSAYNALASDTWSVDKSGTLIGSAPAGTASQAAASGYAVYAMVTNLGTSGFDTKAITTILNDDARRSHLRDEIVKGVASEDYDGVMLDFETIPPADGALYTEFVSNLAQDLHAEGKKLSVVVPAATGSQNEPWNKAYDQPKLGAVADTVVVMAYDYSYASSAAGPVAPIPWVQQALAYSVSRMPADKVVLGLDAYGYDWAGKHGKAVSLTNVDSFLARNHIKPKWDAKAQAPWFQWKDSKGTEHTVYYENKQSTNAKLSLAQTYGVAGVAVWRAGLEDNDFLQTLEQYRKGMQNSSAGTGQ